MRSFRLSGLLISLLFITIPTFRSYSGDLEKTRYTSISKLMEKGLLSAGVMGTGGHEGACMLMILANPSQDSAYIWIEPGRILSSLDTAVQDILITREELLSLAPGESKEVDVYGFCSQASKGSPDSAEMFRVGEMADSTVVDLAEFLNERSNDFPEDAIQKAVWCLTDDYSVMEIFSEDLASIADLRNLVASLKAKEEKWISIEDTPGSYQGFEQYTKTITGEFELFIPTNCIVDIYICDPDGRQLDDFERSKPYKSGTYDYNFRLLVTNWPRGKYTLCIRGDGVLLYEKEFEL